MSIGRKNILITAVIVALIAGLIFFLSNKYDEPAHTVHNAGSTDETAVSELSLAIDEIHEKLDSIRNQRNALISDLNTKNEVASKTQRIYKNIQMLGDLIARSEIQIQKLNEALKKSKTDNAQLNTKLLAYESSREDLIRELENVKYELELSQNHNARLTRNLYDQKKSAERTTAKLYATENIAYTAYYIAGDHSLLKRLNLLDVRGKDLPINEFEKVDTRAEAIIPTHAKNVKVLTSHANGSYNWQDDDQGNKNLCIVEPLQFWKNSRYLIIEVK